MSRAKPGWTPLLPATPVRKTPAQIAALFADMKRTAPEISDDEIRRTLEAAQNELSEVWKNHLYQVHVIRLGAKS